MYVLGGEASTEGDGKLADLLEPTQYYLKFPRCVRGRAGVARLMLVVLAAGLIWRAARYAMGFPLWGDESFVAFGFQVRDFAGMFDPPEYGQFVTLAFMLAEFGVVRLLGLSEWALHLLPFLCGAGALVLFWPMARRMLRPRPALLALGFLASTFFVVRHGNEVKHYILDLLVSIGLLWSAWRVQQEPGSPKRWARLTVLAAVGVWLSFSAIFVAGGVGLVLGAAALRRKSARHVVLAAACGLLLAASFAAMVKLSALPMLRAAPWITETQTWTKAFPPVRQPWRLPWWLLKVHAGRALAYPVGDKNGGSSATLLLVIAGCVSLWRANRRGLLALLLCPLPLNFLAAALRMYPYGTSVRISLHMAPAICLLAGEGLVAWLGLLLNARRVAVGVRVAAAVLCIGALVGAVRDVVRPYKVVSDRENRIAIRSLAAETDRNADQWVIFNTLVPAPHAPHLLADGGGGARFRVYVHKLGPRRIAWGARAEDVQTAEGRTWVLVYKDPPKQFPESLLKRYLEAMSDRFGAPGRRSFPLHMTGKTGAVEAYVFSAPAGRAGPARADH